MSATGNMIGNMQDKIQQLQIENAQLRNKYDCISKQQAVKLVQQKHDDQQAIIDRLMLEFCPDEMSKEQMRVWEHA